jgi:hypothetical protein
MKLNTVQHFLWLNLFRDGTLVQLGAVLKPHSISQMIFFG